MNLSIKQKVTDREKTYGYQGVRENKLGNGDWHIYIYWCTRQYIKYISNKDLLHCTDNSTQYSVMVYVGNESKKEWV